MYLGATRLQWGANKHVLLFAYFYVVYILDWLQSLKQCFINVSYHILVASLTLMALFLKQSHQSKTSYKYTICHIDETLF